MKKIKPQYGKVVPPAVKAEEETGKAKADQVKQNRSVKKPTEQRENLIESETVEQKKSVSPITADPNPFMQTKEVFNQANLTKIGYRMRTEYVEILDIIKKLKKSGYTLEAVLDDALTYYFENSEDGKEALKKAEIFYS